MVRGDTDEPSYSFFHPAPEDKLRDFNPDRPSQFTGPFTVDPGHFQLEMDLANYTLDRRANADVDQWNAAPFDLRVGLTSRTEIDFLYDGYLNVRTRDRGANSVSTQSGFGDLTLLFKYNLFGDDGGTFSFGILPYLKIPTNTANLGNKRVEGGVELPLSINLPANFQLGIQVEFDAVRNDADTRFEPAFTDIAYLGYTFFEQEVHVLRGMVQPGHRGAGFAGGRRGGHGPALLHRQKRGGRFRVQFRRDARGGGFRAVRGVHGAVLSPEI